MAASFHDQLQAQINAFFAGLKTSYAGVPESAKTQVLATELQRLSGVASQYAQSQYMQECAQQGIRQPGISAHGYAGGHQGYPTTHSPASMPYQQMGYRPPMQHTAAYGAQPPVPHQERDMGQADIVDAPTPPPKRLR